jgi:hypothetical protein
VYARIAKFEGGDPERFVLAVEEDASRESPPEGLEGVKGVWMLVDRQSGTTLGVTLFETEEELRRGDEALNAMSPPPESGGRRTNVEMYEVAFRRDFA